MMAANVLTYGPETRKLIAQLYDDDVPILDIGARTGASAKTIQTIAREMGCEIRTPACGPRRRSKERQPQLERAIARYSTTKDTIETICDEEGISRDWLARELNRRGVPRRNATIDCCEAASLRRKFGCNDVARILDAGHQGIGRAIERHKMLLRLGVPPERHEEMRRCTRMQILAKMARDCEDAE